MVSQSCLYLKINEVDKLIHFAAKLSALFIVHDLVLCDYILWDFVCKDLVMWDSIPDSCHIAITAKQTTCSCSF